MGKLLEEIKQTSIRTGKPPRKIDLILEQLNKQDRADLLEAINDHSISPSVISRVLRSKGFEITRTVVQRYRGLYES
jgi:uncharacterized protein (DUF2249 family)